MPTGIAYNNALLLLATQQLDYVNDDIEVLIVDSTYTFDPTHVYVDDLTGELVNDTGTGYERKTVAGKSISIPATTNLVRFFAANPTYQAINTTANGVAAIFYKAVTDDTDSPLICYLEGVSLQTNGSDIEAKLEDGAILDLINANVPE